LAPTRAGRSRWDLHDRRERRFPGAARHGARTFLASLPASQRQAASRFAIGDDAWRPAGIRYPDLPREGRERLEALLGVYTGRIRRGHDEVRWAEVKRHLDATHFAWIGPVDDDSPFYYRIPFGRINLSVETTA
jgi:hypothetical protein